MACGKQLQQIRPVVASVPKNAVPIVPTSTAKQPESSPKVAQTAPPAPLPPAAATAKPKQTLGDYLAIGDWHSFKEIPKGAVAPIVYPGAPEPTSFTEKGAGHVALVWFSRHGRRPDILQPRVARWTWCEMTVRSLAELRKLEAEDAIDVERYDKTERVSLASLVLQLRLDATFTLQEWGEVERILSRFRGNVAVSARVGALVSKPEKPKVKIVGSQTPEQLPPAVAEAWKTLSDEANTSPEAEQALVVLQRLLQKVLQKEP